MPQIPVGPPVSLIAGDTLQFSAKNPDYPASDWTMQFVLFNTSSSQVKFNGVAQSDSGFLVSLTAPQTEDVLPMEYSMAYVFTSTDATQRSTLPLQMTLWVIPDLTQKLNPSPNQIQLANYQEVERKLSTGTNLAVSMNGQSFTKKNIDEIRKQMVWLQARIYREQQQLKELLGNATGGRIVSEFVGVQVGSYPGFTGGSYGN